MYKNIIILVWWLAILVIVKVWNNFNFSNGNSILFIILIVVLPLALYIFGVIYKKRLLKQKNLRKKPFFEIIQDDYKTKKLQKEFLEQVEFLKLNLNSKENQLLLSNNKIEISFEKNYTKINLLNTKITYYFYYSNYINNFTKFDKRMIQYHSTKYLYNQIIELLKKLTCNQLTYMENKKNCKLIDSITKEILYDNNKKTDKKQKYTNVIPINLNENKPF